MPRIKSAIKRAEIAERNRTRNRSWKSAVTTARRKLVEAVKGGELSEAQAALDKAYSVVDRAVAKGVIHRTAGARRKSRLAAQLAALQPQARKRSRAGS